MEKYNSESGQYVKLMLLFLHSNYSSRKLLILRMNTKKEEGETFTNCSLCGYSCNSKQKKRRNHFNSDLHLKNFSIFSKIVLHFKLDPNEIKIKFKSSKKLNPKNFFDSLSDHFKISKDLIVSFELNILNQLFQGNFFIISSLFVRFCDFLGLRVENILPNSDSSKREKKETSNLKDSSSDSTKEQRMERIQNEIEAINIEIKQLMDLKKSFVKKESLNKRKISLVKQEKVFKKKLRKVEKK